MTYYTVRTMWFLALYLHGNSSSDQEGFLLSETARGYGIPIVTSAHPDDILALADDLRIPELGIIVVCGGVPPPFACRQRISRSPLGGIYHLARLDMAGMKLPSADLVGTGVVLWYYCLAHRRAALH